jgi:putative transposase
VQRSALQSSWASQHGPLGNRAYLLPNWICQSALRLDAKSRFNEEQIIAILKESEAGVETGELCRRHGITRASFYRWKSKYGGLELSEAKRLKQLEDENRHLKHVVAELTLDNRALKAVVAKKW